MPELIIGHYQLNDELGAGGMGTVYLGTDTRTGETVAIKQLKANVAQPENIERFQREGEALRELNHPNIVKMLDSFEHENQHYLVMEYVSGGDLKGLIEKGKIPYQACVNMAIDLADALTRAHRLDIIHRDLKPANVLIGDDGMLRLTDFGVAHVGSKERVTDTDAIMGTIDYLPPEAFEGVPFDERGDIWAFGVMLFEMLSDHRPFGGKTIFETIQAITTQPIPDLEALCPDVPIALIDLIYRMLERDLNARIPSVRYVGATLEDILHGRNITPSNMRFIDDTKLPEQSIKHNLPLQTTPFVGREVELNQLMALLNDPSIRLITILAQGGMGKTRLSLELGQRAIHEGLFTDGVYFIELAPVADAHHIPEAITNALGLQLLGNGTPQEQLINILHDRQILLILDNYEHLPDGFGLVDDILKACPHVRIVATSRQQLAQAGETLFHLIGIDFPDWNIPEDAMEFPAMQLFVNHAKRARPTFEVTRNNLGSIYQICSEIQGMPLGIVLAASWVSLLDIDEIFQELQGGLDFLSTDETSIAQRQRSMRSIMDYSWAQMSEMEQQVFMKLSLFRGQFTRDAAQQVADANLRVLMSLVKKSLIRRNADNGRYEIHSLLRQYANEKLSQQSDQHQTYLDYVTYYAELLDQLTGETYYELNLATLQQITLEFNDMQAAWSYISQYPDAIDLIRSFAIYLRRLSHPAPWIVVKLEKSLLSAQEKITDQHTLAAIHEILGRIYRYQGLNDDARQQLKQSLEHIPEDDVMWNVAVMNSFAMTHPQSEQIAILEDAYIRLTTSDLPQTPLWWYLKYVNLLSRLGVYYALANIEQMQRIEDEILSFLDDHLSIRQQAHFRIQQTGTLLRRERYIIPLKYIELLESHKQFLIENGTPYEQLDLILRVGLLWLFRFDPDRAEPSLKLAAQICHDIGESRQRLIALTYLTVLYRMRYHLEQVESFADEAHQLALKINNDWYIGTAMMNKAWLAWVNGDSTKALTMALDGLTHWNETYPFKWIGLILLIALSVEQEQYDDAIHYTEMLLHPVQQKMPDTLESLLKQAVTHWQNQQAEEAIHLFKNAVDEAKQQRLL